MTETIKIINTHLDEKTKEQIKTEFEKYPQKFHTAFVVGICIVNGHSLLNNVDFIIEEK